MPENVTRSIAQKLSDRLVAETNVRRAQRNVEAESLFTEIDEKLRNRFAQSGYEYQPGEQLVKQQVAAAQTVIDTIPQSKFVAASPPRAALDVLKAEIRREVNSPQVAAQIAIKPTAKTQGERRTDLIMSQIKQKTEMFETDSKPENEPVAAPQKPAVPDQTTQALIKLIAEHQNLKQQFTEASATAERSETKQKQLENYIQKQQNFFENKFEQLQHRQQSLEKELQEVISVVKQQQKENKNLRVKLFKQQTRQKLTTQMVRSVESQQQFQIEINAQFAFQIEDTRTACEQMVLEQQNRIVDAVVDHLGPMLNHIDVVPVCPTESPLRDGEGEGENGANCSNEEPADEDNECLHSTVSSVHRVPIATVPQLPVMSGENCCEQQPDKTPKAFAGVGPRPMIEYDEHELVQQQLASQFNVSGEFDVTHPHRRGDELEVLPLHTGELEQAELVPDFPCDEQLVVVQLGEDDLMRGREEMIEADYQLLDDQAQREMKEVDENLDLDDLVGVGSAEEEVNHSDANAQALEMLSGSKTIQQIDEFLKSLAAEEEVVRSQKSVTEANALVRQLDEELM